MHQKHPPAKVATACPGGTTTLVACAKASPEAMRRAGSNAKRFMRFLLEGSGPGYVGREGAGLTRDRVASRPRHPHPPARYGGSRSARTGAPRVRWKLRARV